MSTKRATVAAHDWALMAGVRLVSFGGVVVGI